MSFITLHLPVSKPIKKFLTAHFGEEYQPTQSDWLGILISSLLNRKSASNWETRAMKREHFEEIYNINIRLSYADKHGIFLMPIHENPTDYDFCGIDARYICGMSVPPFMIAKIANEIKKQWFLFPLSEDKII